MAFHKGGQIIWLGVILLLMLVSGAYFFMGIRPVIIENDQMRASIERMLAARREMMMRPEGPPSELLVSAMREEAELRERAFEQILGTIPHELPVLLPPEISRPGIYWMETLQSKRRALAETAGDAGLSVPADLGFRAGLPSEEEVPSLLFRMAVVEDLVTIAAGSKMRSITAVAFGEGEDAIRSGELHLRKVPLDFTVEASLEGIFRFMDKLRRGRFLYVIDDMRLEVVHAERVEFEERPEEERAPFPRARRPRDFEEDEEFYEDPEPGISRVETRIRERFLSAALKVYMYYSEPGSE